MTRGLKRRICAASASTAASSSVVGTTWFTSPHSSAVAASTGSPGEEHLQRALAADRAVSGTIGVEQKSPMRTPGVAKVAVSAATARSHAATSWQPAAVATPWTWAITGWRRSCSRQHHLGADVEQLVVEGGVAPDHLG